MQNSFSQSLDMCSRTKSCTNPLTVYDFQVLTIRGTFDKNIKELYLCYLKSPRHMEFGLSGFWDYLNYNEYYSEVIGKEMGYSAFPA